MLKTLAKGLEVSAPLIMFAPEGAAVNDGELKENWVVMLLDESV